MSGPDLIAALFSAAFTAWLLYTASRYPSRRD
jgi:hypothetical protein